ncbi:MAG TPA: PaaI family thioesterase [Acidimicrobiia bacterium]
MPDEPSPSFPQFDARVAAGLEAVADAGGLPGFLGLTHTDVGPGTLTARVPVRPELLTPFGNLHGGVLAALCDHVLGTVCYPVIARGAWAATTEFKLNYLAPITGGALEATARILSLTKRTAVVRIDVMNDGRAVCMAQGTVLIMAPKAGDGGESTGG